jgi:hypothetical protein
MLKFCTCLIFFAVIYKTVSGQENSLSEIKLSGKVKSVSVQVTMNAKLISTNTTTYNPAGNKETVIFPNRNVTYVYNTDGTLKFSKEVNVDGTVFFLVHAYDLHKYPTAISWCQDSLFKNCRPFRVFRHDEHGNRTEEILYAEDGTKTKTSQYKFDDNNRMLEMKSIKPGDNNKFGLDNTTHYIYNQTGLLSETKSSLISFVYQYNEKGEETGSVEYIMGRKSKNKTLEYKYDTQGNWIKLVEHNSSVSGSDSYVILVERTILYY